MTAGFLSAFNVTLVSSLAWTNATPAGLGFNVSASGLNCSLWTNQSGTFSVQQNATNVTNASVVSFNQSFAEGAWLWTVSCTDGVASVFAPENKSLGVDFTAPTAPAFDFNGYNVSWNVATDALSGVSRYDVYRNDTLVYNTTNSSRPSFLDSGNESFYVYRLRVTDASGNSNESNATYVPLLQMSNVSFSKVAPRFFNVTWLTDAPANASLVWTAPDAVLRNVTDASLLTNHSGQVFTPLFGSFSVLLTSCRRSCLNQTLTFNATPTVNFTFAFYNATYQNQSAVFSATWLSAYGLARLNLYSNNSGNWTLDYSSTFPNVPMQLSNVFFTLNATAREVDWAGNATDALGEVVAFPLYRLLLSANPNAVLASPTPVPTPVPTVPVDPVLTPQPTAEAQATPQATPTVAPLPVVLPTATPGPEALSGFVVNLPVSSASAADSLTGFLSFSDVLQKPVSFNVTYPASSTAAPVYLSVRVVDVKNATVALVRSESRLPGGSSLILQTPPVTLPVGDYEAQAAVVADQNGGVVLAASKYPFKLAGAAQDVTSALLGVVAMGVIFILVFSLKISKHKKRLLE